MRQAGRYLPAYRAVRSKVDFLTLCRTPELVAEVSIQPVDILGVDAAVIFSDILILLQAMGLAVRFEEAAGPRIVHPIRSPADVRRLRTPDIQGELSPVAEGIRLTTRALAARAIPVIGFAGAPFTLACYAIDGGTTRDFLATKRFLHEEPGAFRNLLERLAEAVVAHLKLQIEAGAAAVQLFDTWGGLVDRETYRKWLLPPLGRIVRSIRSMGCPIILYINGSTPHLDNMRASGADVLSVDWRLPLAEVRHRVGKGPTLQGNLDPAVLYSAPAAIRRATRSMIRGHGRLRLIANLGHGVPPDAPVDHVRVFVEAVQSKKGCPADGDEAESWVS